MQLQNTSSVGSVSARSASVTQSLLAVFFGLVIVGFVGFSHVEAAHNAAHDSRHANAFPCH